MRAAGRTLREAGVEAIAVCFLFSYLDPAHEERAAEILREEAPDCFVTTSASISPQFREFERFTTACMNAFVGPGTGRYLERLTDGLSERGVSADLLVMRSNGGVASVAEAAERPGHADALRPRRGRARRAVGRASSPARRRLITFDMGGTSADIGLVTEAGINEASARDTHIADYPLLVPMFDIETIGAGGGSIAHVDAAGAFKVGPRSAGAVPGPAAYGQGGTSRRSPTRTSCSGASTRPASWAARWRSTPPAPRPRSTASPAELGMERLEAAAGILTVANANMAQTIRSITVERGRDPREFALVAFGGAGPLHAAERRRHARRARGARPAAPGDHVGHRAADQRPALRQHGHGLRRRGRGRRRGAERALRRPGGRAAGAAARATAPTRDAVTLERFLDCRYAGQGYELRIPVGEEGYTDATLAAFHAAHEAEYGHAFSDPIEVVNLRVTATGPRPEAAARERRRRHAGGGGGRRGDDGLARRRRARVAAHAAPAARAPAGRRADRRPRDPLPARHHDRRAAGLDGDRHGHRPTRPHDPGGRRMTATDSRPAVDAITAAVIGGSLRSIADEMGYRLARMSYSSIIRESEDFGCAICDAEGRQLCEATQSTPLQSGPIGGYLAGIARRFEEVGDEWREGDVVVHNHPYYGASHQPDVGFAVPVFVDGELVGFSVTTAHHLDLGALTPGSCGIVNAGDAFAEGLLLNAVKVEDAGRRNESRVADHRATTAASPTSWSATWTPRSPRPSSARRATRR